VCELGFIAPYTERSALGMLAEPSSPLNRRRLHVEHRSNSLSNKIRDPGDWEEKPRHLADRAAAGLKASSLGRSLRAIVQAHLGASHASPRSASVRAVLQGIRRRHGAAPAQKAPLSLKEPRSMVEPLGVRHPARLERSKLYTRAAATASMTFEQPLLR
jgi:hypothetical protein